MIGSFVCGAGMRGEKEFSPCAPLIFFFELSVVPERLRTSLNGRALFESNSQPALSGQSPRAKSGPRRTPAAAQNSEKIKNGSLGEIHFPQPFTLGTGIPQ